MPFLSWALFVFAVVFFGLHLVVFAKPGLDARSDAGKVRSWHRIWQTSEYLSLGLGALGIVGLASGVDARMQTNALWRILAVPTNPYEIEFLQFEQSARRGNASDGDPVPSWYQGAIQSLADGNAIVDEAKGQIAGELAGQPVQEGTVLKLLDGAEKKYRAFIDQDPDLVSRPDRNASGTINGPVWTMKRFKDAIGYTQELARAYENANLQNSNWYLNFDKLAAIALAIAFALSLSKVTAILWVPTIG